jgi:hypothetical protein
MMTHVRLHNRWSVTVAEQKGRLFFYRLHIEMYLLPYALTTLYGMAHEEYCHVLE